jgi:hypothetical protein
LRNSGASAVASGVDRAAASHVSSARSESISGVGNPVDAENVLGARLVEAEREREWIAARVGDVEKLADRRNVGLTVRAVESLGDVEDDVGAFGAEALGECFGRFEADDVSIGGERGSDGVDRVGGVPLRVRVVDTGRLFLGAWLRGDRAHQPYGRLRFLVVREADARHPVSVNRPRRRCRQNLELREVPRDHSPTWGARQMPIVIVAQNTNTVFFAQ